MEIIEYKQLGTVHANDIVMLHKKVYPVDQLRHTIFYSPRVARYIAVLLSFPRLQRQNHCFLGAFAQEQLVGYAHYRVLHDALHLNQIVVDPEYQGQGIGRALYQAWKDLAKKLGLKTLSLDVTENNEKAYSWYLRLGFVPVSRTLLYEKRISDFAILPSHSVDFSLVDWENTLAWYKTYGFAIVRVECNTKLWEARWTWKSLCIRENLPDYLVQALLSMVFQHYNMRWLFLQFTEPPQDTSQWRFLGITTRMEAPIWEVK